MQIFVPLYLKTLLLFTHGGSLDGEDSVANQMPPRITPSEVSLVDTA